MDCSLWYLGLLQDIYTGNILGAIPAPVPLPRFGIARSFTVSSWVISEGVLLMMQEKRSRKKPNFITIILRKSKAKQKILNTMVKYNIMKPKNLMLLILTPLLFQACQQTGASETDRKNQKQPEAAKQETVIHLTKEQFQEKVMDYTNSETWNFKGDKPCIVDFYADWCAPCRITSPIMEELARKYEGKIHFYKVDIDKEKELASVMGIRSIPTFLYCPLEGKPLISSGIGQSKDQTRQMFIHNIEQILLKSR